MRFALLGSRLLQCQNLRTRHSARLRNHVNGDVQREQRACHIEYALAPPLAPTLSQPLSQSLSTSCFQPIPMVLLVLHIECHVLPPRFLLYLHPLDFFCQSFCKLPLHYLAIYIAQEALKICIDSTFQPLCIEKDLRCPIAKLQRRQLDAGIPKRIVSFFLP